MKMPTNITPEVLEEISRIGDKRKPLEACGVLLPFPHKNKWVWEMPNRSKTPECHFVFNGADVQIALENWDADEDDWYNLTVWHTHPNGSIGPSKGDMECRAPDLGNLVVSLFDDELSKATWY